MTFIIAEAGLAHMGKVDNAFRLVDEAKLSGADAIKFQVYRTKELIRPQMKEWYDRYKLKELSYEAYVKVKDYADRVGIEFFGTPHTESALKFLKTLGVRYYKIGSGEKGSDLFKKILNVGKKTFISTGMRNESEILELIEAYGGRKRVFLHCITLYSTPPHLLNMAFLKRLIRFCGQFKSEAGYSCHCSGIEAVKIAVSIGATVIEKHLKIPESEGQDTLVALDGKEFRRMVGEIRSIEQMLGEEERIYSAEERESEKWALKTNGMRG